MRQPCNLNEFSCVLVLNPLVLPSLTGPSPETEEERDHSHGRGTISLLVPSPGLAGRWLTVVLVTLRCCGGEQSSASYEGVHLGIKCCFNNWNSILKCLLTTCWVGVGGLKQDVLPLTLKLTCGWFAFSSRSRSNERK